MDEELIICSYSEDSFRHAMLADDGLTGILYLHSPSEDPTKTGKVEADCFAYNRIEPIDPKQVHSYRPNPPPIARGYASKHAVCRRPKSHEWRLVWSTDGNAVVLLRDGDPWAMALRNIRGGFSKAIQLQGPWGSPWSMEAYEGISWGGRGRLCK